MHPIRAYRHAQTPKVSLLELATKVGVSKSYLSRVETGTEPLTVELGEKLSRETGVPMGALFPKLAKMFEAQAAQ